MESNVLGANTTPWLVGVVGFVFLVMVMTFSLEVRSWRRGDRRFNRAGALLLPLLVLLWFMLALLLYADVAHAWSRLAVVGVTSSFFVAGVAFVIFIILLARALRMSGASRENRDER